MSVKSVFFYYFFKSVCRLIDIFIELPISLFLFHNKIYDYIFRQLCNNFAKSVNFEMTQNGSIQTQSIHCIIYWKLHLLKEHFYIFCNKRKKIGIAVSSFFFFLFSRNNYTCYSLLSLKIYFVNLFF